MTHKFASLDADITTKSRSITKPGSYMILAQADRVNSKLPNWRNTDAKIMTTPALGAKFVEYEMFIHPGGGTKKPVDDGLQHFLFVLEGEATFEMGGKTYELIRRRNDLAATGPSLYADQQQRSHHADALAAPPLYRD